MKLKTTELRRFFSASSPIKSNGILPVLDYVKVENDKIIKTNNAVYLSMPITPVGETILLDDNILSSLVKNTTADEIKVELKGTKVYLSDGTNKTFFALSDPKFFPVFPDSEKENFISLNSDVLKAIGVAAKNVNSSGIKESFDFIHLAHDYVFGSDHFRFYFKKFEKLPVVSIDTFCANIISQYGRADFYQKNNYNFFEIGTLLYGFAQHETKSPDFPSFLTFFTQDEYMEINVPEVLSFLELLTSCTSGLTVTCNFDGGKLSFYDTDLEVGNDRSIEVKGIFKPKVSFLPRLMIPYFKSLGKTTLRFSPMSGGRSGINIWDENDLSFKGMLAVVENNQ